MLFALRPLQLAFQLRPAHLALTLPDRHSGRDFSMILVGGGKFLIKPEDEHVPRGVGWVNLMHLRVELLLIIIENGDAFGRDARLLLDRLPRRRGVSPPRVV